MTKTVGWVLLALPVLIGVYAYVLYPVILWILARFSRADNAAKPNGNAEPPLVTVVVPAYNEEHQIRETIEALLAQDYPHDRLQILILSDASTDRTDEIVREYAQRGVELLRMPVRGGKTAAENASCAVIRGDIVVNSDASVRLHPIAVRRLVEEMSDPHVGVASTRDVSVAPGESTANVTEAGYVGYEMMVRSLETRTGGIVGASGSGYAIRAHLHRLPVRADLSRDFSAALTARLHAMSAVSVDDAVCFVPRTTSLRSEYRRKVRTIARGLDTLIYRRSLADPIVYGAFGWKLLSHKICRWLVPATAIPAAIGLLLLARTEPWAFALIAMGVMGLAVSATGALWPVGRPIPKVISVITFAVAANLAVIHAIFRVINGHEDHLWEPTRRPATATVTPQYQTKVLA